MENIKMDLFEQYIKQASKYLVEDEEDFDIDDTTDDVPAEDDAESDMQPCPDCGGEGEIDGETCETCGGTGEVPVEGDAGEEDDEALELDLANPVCPACGAALIPVGGDIYADDVEDDEEAAAIELLQGLGYTIVAPKADEEGEEVDDDFAGEDDDIADEDDDDFDDEDKDDFEADEE
jgi:hypothetical protein